MHVNGQDRLDAHWYLAFALFQRTIVGDFRETVHDGTVRVLY